MLESELTSIEVLGLGVAQEIEAYKRYRLFATKVRNPLVREKFRSLAHEEHAHREMLYSLLQRYTGESKPPLPKKAPRRSQDAEVNLPLSEILTLAITKEREAQAFYRRAATNSTDPTGKRLLLYLALFEEGHERTLQIEYDALAKYPQWFDIDGADIQLVGP
jgi:erythrin-vacuolar iron transport family protein